MKLIQISNLSRIYQKGKIIIPALQNIDLEIEAGQFVSIVGKSGSGKSTLLNLIGGLDRATAGKILFNGNDLHTMSRSGLAQHRKKSVGMIFQSFNLIQSRSALENVDLALTFGGVPRNRRKAIATGLLQKVGLGDRINHLPDELSGGETQRVAIARALANKPTVLLADEPTGNLDSETSKEIMELLVDLNKNQGITIILVSHDQESARQVSDWIVKLKDGSVDEIILREEAQCV
ncbi:MAG: ABC transporter ATP-binding protein [Bacteroidales bacterium]|nr:ABC transporter ATP-binding protein [Bacteroidales bacterium]NCU35694.1 ABC transporter ATP-binding protein [Candidatus Falkowbacteria bacterium]MDD2632520.1 ABC transporter ATP-binding protein [Bacteroidales bacterium]MDD3130901.1 ABC transporter ATP-binding protein [Bacteroidales bacterium]MDD3527223.1 ABC transporter ATP-binding protein [Bacteroidales bacterium]